MAFPALLPITYTNGVQSLQVCERAGVPDNGPNVVSLPWVGQGTHPSLIDLDRISIQVKALGASVTGASITSLAADKQTVTINFVQTGNDSALITATLRHTTNL